MSEFTKKKKKSSLAHIFWSLVLQKWNCLIKPVYFWFQF